MIRRGFASRTVLAAAASLVLAASLLVLTLAQLGISRQGLDRKTGRDDG